MNPIVLTLLLLLAPVFYFTAGLPWALATARIAWAPLWGMGALGLVAELAYVGGAPVGDAVMVAGGMHVLAAGWLVGQAPDCWPAVGQAAADFGRAYVLALIPLAVAPFPLPGGWGGDWLMALGAGEHVLAGTRFTPELLARPPLFGAAAAPLLWAAPGLEAFQVFCALASAAALQVFRSALPPRSDWRLLGVLAGSVFFLQVTANAWGKFLCAAFLLAAWLAMDPAGARRDRWIAGVLLGLALATHQAALLFVPLVLARGWPAGAGSGHGLAALAGTAVLAVVPVLPWELHTLETYGWAAKWLANPAVSQRLADVPPWLNATLVGVTTFVAWGPLEIVRHWLSAADRFTVSRLAHEVYWFATSACNSGAGCLLGLALPWWLALGPHEFRRHAAEAWGRVSRSARVGLALALLGQMLLNPFYSPDGSLQAGGVPAGIALALACAGLCAAGPAARLARVLRCTFWCATLPWVLFNLGLTASLVMSPAFRREYTDSDLQQIDANHWVSLGMAGFPWLQVLLAAGTGLLWFGRPPRSWRETFAGSPAIS